MINAEELIRTRLHYTTCGDSAKIFEWIKDEASVEDRHYIALYGNLCFIDTAILHYIIAMPDCDLSTALTLFFKMRPSFYIEHGISAQDVMDGSFYSLLMLNDIRERFYDDHYKSSIFEFKIDPYERDDILKIKEKDWLFADFVERFVPEEMMQDRVGVSLDYRPEWYEGLPPFISNPESDSNEMLDK